MIVQDIASQSSDVFQTPYMTEETQFPGFMFPQVMQNIS